MSPIVPSVQRASYSFSSEVLSLSSGVDTYFRFSGQFADPGGGVTRDEAASILNANEGIVTISSEKFATRAGSLTRLILRGTAPVLYQWFVDVDSGGGYVRTSAMAAPALLASNTTTVIDPDVVVEFAVGDRIRSGLLITSNAVLDLQAELEISTTL